MHCKPEEWDPLDPRAIEYLEAHGMGGVLEELNATMCNAWKFRMGCVDIAPDYDPDDMNNLATFCAFSNEREAFGYYNAILVWLSNRDDPLAVDVWHMVYDWGHYSVFY
jgi:hypothetical protein